MTELPRRAAAVAGEPMAEHQLEVERPADGEFAMDDLTRLAADHVAAGRPVAVDIGTMRLEPIEAAPEKAAAPRRMGLRRALMTATASGALWSTMPA